MVPRAHETRSSRWRDPVWLTILIAAATLLFTAGGVAVAVLAWQRPRAPVDHPVSAASAPAALVSPVASGTSSAVLRQMLRADDCLDSQTIRSNGQWPWPTYLYLVPCSGPHDGQAIFVGSGWLDSQAYPGADAAYQQWRATCEREFAAYVGLPYGNSALAYTGWLPDEESWAAGIRQIACIVYDPKGPITGSARGSGR